MDFIVAEVQLPVCLRGSGQDRFIARYKYGARDHLLCVEALLLRSIILNCTTLEVRSSYGIEGALTPMEIVRAAWTIPAQCIRPGITMVAPSVLDNLHH